MAATQEDLDNLANQVGELDQKLKAGINTVQTEVDSLEQQIQAGTATNELDVTKLQDAVAALTTDVEGVQDIKPSSTPGTAALEAPPTNTDGTAAENTTDPEKAAGA
jgi:hypothetical protein